jgi:hypothetical protein
MLFCAAIVEYADGKKLMADDAAMITTINLIRLCAEE